jgi:hypothetical protein
LRPSGCMGFTKVESIDTDIVLLRIKYQHSRPQLTILPVKHNHFSVELVVFLAEIRAKKLD